MPSPVSSVVDQVGTAMSVASLQQRVISSNIANRDTQGYRRLQLQFDRAMENASAVVVVAEPETPNPVSIEQDLVAASSNAAQYRALARVLNRYFSVINSITSSGRG